MACHINAVRIGKMGIRQPELAGCIIHLPHKDPQRRVCGQGGIVPNRPSGCHRQDISRVITALEQHTLHALRHGHPLPPVNKCHRGPLIDPCDFLSGCDHCSRVYILQCHISRKQLGQTSRADPIPKLPLRKQDRVRLGIVYEYIGRKQREIRRWPGSRSRVITGACRFLRRVPCLLCVTGASLMGMPAGLPFPDNSISPQQAHQQQKDGRRQDPGSECSLHQTPPLSRFLKNTQPL